MWEGILLPNCMNAGTLCDGFAKLAELGRYHIPINEENVWCVAYNAYVTCTPSFPQVSAVLGARSSLPMCGTAHYWLKHCYGMK